MVFKWIWVGALGQLFILSVAAVIESLSVDDRLAGINLAGSETKMATSRMHQSRDTTRLGS